AWGNYEVSVGNVNGGGDDLIWVSLETGTKRVYFATRSPGSDDLTRSAPFTKDGFWWASFNSRVLNGNSDTKTDLLQYFTNPSTEDKVTIYVDVATSSEEYIFGDAQDLVQEDVNWNDFELLIGDVNGDGIDDLVWVDESDGSSNNRIITGLGNTDGKFDFEIAEMQHPAEETWSQYVPILLDLDGDRNQDLVWIKPGGSASIYVGLGRE
ncbi:MAG: VCBS repeat-containing protein, partial [Bacteroidota bacterium]